MPTQSTFVLLVFSALLALTPFNPVWANQPSPEILRWIDAQGRVHFGEEAPTGVNAERINLPAVARAPKPSPSSEAPKEVKKPAPKKPKKKTAEPKPKKKSSRKKSARKAPTTAALERQRLSHRSKCIEAQAKLRRIETRLRQGVKTKQGERLRERQHSWGIVKREYCTSG